MKYVGSNVCSEFSQQNFFLRGESSRGSRLSALRCREVSVLFSFCFSLLVCVSDSPLITFFRLIFRRLCSSNELLALREKKVELDDEVRFFVFLPLGSFHKLSSPQAKALRLKKKAQEEEVEGLLGKLQWVS